MARLSDHVQMTPSAGFKVLIADDTASSRSMLEAFLRKLGFSVVTAADGREALERFEQERPDLVLMDVMMPGIDGFDATRRIRQLQGGRWVPLVMLSALSGESDIAAGLDAGADDYLVKPISFAVFSAKMRSLTRQLTMQRTVTESLEQIRAISDAVIDGIVTLDQNAVIQSCNPAACRAFGYTQGELIGRNVSMLMPEPYRSEHDGYVMRYLTTGEARVVGRIRQVSAQRKNGEIFPLELGVTDIALPDRHLFVGVVRDVTEREGIARERAETRASLEQLYSEQEQEQELARRIMELQIHGDWLKDPRVQYAVMPTSKFSGDVVMLARSPAGATYALLADATGHGLAAAISVLPILSLFYASVARDMPLEALVAAINDQLLAALPVGHFVGAAVFSVSAAAREGEIWVGGVPAPLLINAAGGVARRFPSLHVPLGIVASEALNIRSERFAIAPGQQLLLCSDGLLEACDPNGAPFGSGQLERVLAASPPESRVAAVQRALSAHLAGAPHHDDVSMLLLSCVPHPEMAALEP